MKSDKIVKTAWERLAKECPANAYHMTYANSDEPGGPYVGLFIKLPDQLQVVPGMLQLGSRDIAKDYVSLLLSHGIVQRVAGSTLANEP